MTTLSELRKSALIADLVRRFRDENHFCGETHVQKSVFFLQHLFGIPFEFEYLLYKYGPFSFDLRDHLGSMQANQMLTLSPRLMGATFEPGEQIGYLEKRFPKTLAQYATELDFVEKHLGGKTVKELERLATALHFRIENPRDLVEARAKRVVEAKPHVSPEDARSAVMMVDEWHASIDSHTGAPAKG